MPFGVFSPGYKASKDAYITRGRTATLRPLMRGDNTYSYTKVRLTPRANGLDKSTLVLRNSRRETTSDISRSPALSLLNK